MALCTTDQKVSTLLVVLVLMWRRSIVRGFLFLSHHRQIPSTSLLNSLMKQKVCMINVRWDVNAAHVTVTPSADTIYQSVRQSDEAESVYDKCAMGRKRGACDRMKETVRAKAISRSTSRRVRPSAQQIGFSTNATWEISHNYFSLFP
jgi:hypothetical protein